MIAIESRCYDTGMYKGGSPNLAGNDEGRVPGAHDPEPQWVNKYKLVRWLKVFPGRRNCRNKGTRVMETQ